MFYGKSQFLSKLGLGLIVVSLSASVAVVLIKGLTLDTNIILRLGIG
jgi:hypothetical protein